MAWIESNQEVGRHPKTRKLARRLGISLPAAVGHLHYLWWWALDFAQDGDLDKYDNDDIADAMCWDGDSDQLVEALVDVGYIDCNERGELVLHDWRDYAGKLLERREKDRARKNKPKETEAIPQEFQRNSNGTKKETDGIRKDSSVTVPNSTIHNSIDPPLSPQGEETPPSQDKQFSEFWQEFPKKVGKKAACKAWEKLKPDAELFERIIQGVKAAKLSEQWIRESGRYIPHPTTWLNEGRWDDEMPPGSELERRRSYDIQELEQMI